jgi:hypothetical protein
VPGFRAQPVTDSFSLMTSSKGTFQSKLNKSNEGKGYISHPLIIIFLISQGIMIRLRTGINHNVFFNSDLCFIKRKRNNIKMGIVANLTVNIYMLIIKTGIYLFKSDFASLPDRSSILAKINRGMVVDKKSGEGDDKLGNLKMIKNRKK